MIAAVRQQLGVMGKSACENTTLHGQEKGRSVNLRPSSSGEAIKIRVDGCLITNTKRCDCLYFYQHSKSKRLAILVELKGTHYDTALEQLIATKRHENYTQLFDAAKPTHKFAVVIVSKNANTNRPDKEKWENENGIRLRVFSSENNEAIELVEKLIKNND